MTKMPSVVYKRVNLAVSKFKKILLKARERDVNEADTVTIIMDILEEVFGFDKYSEITREYCIQGTYCDLAIKDTNKIRYLVEVKAIGSTLKTAHLKQAVNYASHEGVKWVVLTNGLVWEIHRVNVEGQVEHECLVKFNFMDLNTKNEDHKEIIFLLCKRGLKKDLMDGFYEYRQSVNPYTVAAILLTDKVLMMVRRDLGKFRPGIKVDIDEIKTMIYSEVIKRDLLDSEAAQDAQKQVTKALKNYRKEKIKRQEKNQINNEVNPEEPS